METTHVSMDGGINKQNVVYAHNGILFILKKKENLAIQYNVDESNRHYTKWNKPKKENHYKISIIDRI